MRWVEIDVRKREHGVLKINTSNNNELGLSWKSTNKTKLCQCLCLGWIEFKSQSKSQVLHFKGPSVQRSRNFIKEPERKTMSPPHLFGVAPEPGEGQDARRRVEGRSARREAAEDKRVSDKKLLTDDKASHAQQLGWVSGRGVQETREGPDAAESLAELGAGRQGEGGRPDSNLAMEAEVREGSKGKRSTTNVPNNVKKGKRAKWDFYLRHQKDNKARAAFRELRERSGRLQGSPKHVHKATFVIHRASSSIHRVITFLLAYLFNNVEGTDIKKNCP